MPEAGSRLRSHDRRLRMATAEDGCWRLTAAPGCPSPTRACKERWDMRTQVSMARVDRPWHRPGALWYALRRLPGLLHPPVDVYEPATGSLSMLRDLPVVVRDGTTLRVNVVLPAGGWRVNVQYRVLRQTGLCAFPP